MKRIYISILAVLAVFGRIEAQWFNLTSPTNSYLYSTYFVNYDTGYAVGGGLDASVFLKTTNGGTSWDMITNTQTKWLYDLVFLTDSVGLACGYDGAMYKTTNAGTTWEAKPSQTTAWLYALAKKPDGTVFAIGQDGVLIRSTNAGNNWSNVVSNTGQTMLDIQFYDNNYGAAVGYAGEMIYTTDGGNNWAVKLMGTPGSITGVWMLSPDTIWTCGLEGKIYKTTNAGQSFTFSTNGLNDLNAIFFTDHTNGYLAGNQKIYHTSNGGVNWDEMLPYPTPNAMKDIFISPDNRVMYAVGDHGAIIKNINTIGIEPVELESITVYPNPASSEIFIPITGNVEVKIWDMNGRLQKNLLQESIDNLKISLDGLPNGIFIVEVIKQNTHYLGKVVVKH
jgi:photosystem II stability/assembly factor-like uncharacterized protein